MPKESCGSLLAHMLGMLCTKDVAHLSCCGHDLACTSSQAMTAVMTQPTSEALPGGAPTAPEQAAALFEVLHTCTHAVCGGPSSNMP